MSCIPAPSCKAALNQATARWPGRSTASDGICASDDHNQQNPNSDHATGNAWDLTRDLAHGVDTRAIADWLRERVLAGLEPRIKYLISEARIFNLSISPEWRPYSGSNGHYKHMHCSIKAEFRDDTRPWFAGFPDQGGNDVGDLSGTALGEQQRAELSNVNQNVAEVEAGVNLANQKLDQLLQPSGPPSLSNADVARVAKAVVDLLQVRLQS